MLAFMTDVDYVHLLLFQVTEFPVTPIPKEKLVDTNAAGKSFSFNILKSHRNSFHWEILLCFD